MTHATLEQTAARLQSTITEQQHQLTRQAAELRQESHHALTRVYKNHAEHVKALTSSLNFEKTQLEMARKDFSANMEHERLMFDARESELNARILDLQSALDNRVKAAESLQTQLNQTVERVEASEAERRRIQGKDQAQIAILEAKVRKVSVPVFQDAFR
jgi:hypothetical protein